MEKTENTSSDAFSKLMVMNHMQEIFEMDQGQAKDGPFGMAENSDTKEILREGSQKVKANTFMRTVRRMKVHSKTAENQEKASIHTQIKNITMESGKMI